VTLEVEEGKKPRMHFDLRLKAYYWKQLCNNFDVPGGHSGCHVVISLLEVREHHSLFIKIVQLLGSRKRKHVKTVLLKNHNACECLPVTVREAATLSDLG